MLEKPQALVDHIAQLCRGKRIWVAYSGGVDSHVLLHLLATSNHPDLSQIYAVHIDHGLHDDSVMWQQHCKSVAENLAVDFYSLRVNVEAIAELGLEAAARKARYAAFSKLLTNTDVLLTAQHQRDQAETVLLQLLRGAGPYGLSAMAEQRHMAELDVVRPLLTTPKSVIMAYAAQYQLHWLDDPSNLDVSLNRNYLRHIIWPEIQRRWPSADTTLSRSAQHCADASSVMTEIAVDDASLIGFSATEGTFAIPALLSLSQARQRNVLRYLISKLGFSMPSTIVLQRVLEELCLAQQDAQPLVSWPSVEVRRFHDKAYLMVPIVDQVPLQPLIIDTISDIEVSDGCILHWQQSDTSGIRLSSIEKGLQLRYRQGGEKLSFHGQHHSLKKLFQQWEIPPWQRDRVPLLFQDDELIAVVGYSISDKLLKPDSEACYIPMIKMLG